MTSKTRTLTVLAGIERLAGHLEQGVERAALSGCPLAVVTGLLLLLRVLPLELLLLLLLLLLLHARMHTCVEAVHTVMMDQGVRTAGVGDGAATGGGGTA